MVAVVTPLPLEIVLVMLVIGVAYASFALFLQRRLVNQKRVKEIQLRMKELTKEMQEMSKRKEDITEKQKELMPLMSESMKHQFKAMFIILPLFFAVYYVALPNAFAAFNGDVYNFFVPLSYLNIFFISAFLCGIVLSISISIRDRIRAKRASKGTVQLETK
jgi:uncharacterized membrane protein (DUF106 family)